MISCFFSIDAAKVQKKNDSTSVFTAELFYARKKSAGKA
jgi:hypothetical protein